MKDDDLTEKLFKFNLAIDQHFTNLRKVVEEIKKKQHPRRQFNLWRNSKEGKTWKQEQYQKQNEKCLLCGEYLKISFSHIDHIKPINKYPELAITHDNLQLVHPECNVRKGKIFD